MISFTEKGSFNRTERYLRRLQYSDLYAVLDKYGEIGVVALADATPKDTSETANSWYYEIVQRPGYYSIRWRNRHIPNGIPVAILIQYGHGTRTGGYVQGYDYVNPAIRPIFERMIADISKEVTKQ